MNKDIRKIMLTSPVWKYQKIIDICNNQSMEGYQLEKIKMFGKSIFRKRTDKKYVYDIDFNGVILKKGKERESYLEMFKEQGWEFVDNTFNGFSIFKKEYKENTPLEDYKIYTDSESSKELYSRLECLLKTILILFLPTEFILVTAGTICLALSGDFSIKQLIIIPLVFLLVFCLPLTIFIIRGIKYIKKMKKE